MDHYSLVSKLRQRAVWCRELALGPCSTRLAQGLEATAEEYEADANRIAGHGDTKADALADGDCSEQLKKGRVGQSKRQRLRSSQYSTEPSNVRAH